MAGKFSSASAAHANSGFYRRRAALAALLVLPALWGIDGVWLAVTAAELATLAVTVYMFVTKDQKFHYRHV